MFWDQVAGVYDIFADVVNRRTHKKLRTVIAKLLPSGGSALECACGTGLLTGVIAGRCEYVIATDFSAEMLKRARKKYALLPNVRFEQADILHLPYETAQFDAVVAANVIHLLDDPQLALRELSRVTKPGGVILLPTYMNRTKTGKTNRVSGAIGKAGANFKREFTPDTYRQFFEDAGYPGVEITLCEGVIPCAVAVLQKRAQENFYAASHT